MSDCELKIEKTEYQKLQEAIKNFEADGMSSEELARFSTIQYIKDQMRERRWTPAKLGKKIGCSEFAVQKILRGDPYSLETSRLLALTFGISTDFFAAGRHPRIIPDREKWLFENKEAYHSLMKGLDDAKAGRVRERKI